MNSVGVSFILTHSQQTAKNSEHQPSLSLKMSLMSIAPCQIKIKLSLMSMVPCQFKVKISLMSLVPCQFKVKMSLMSLVPCQFKVKMPLMPKVPCPFKVTMSLMSVVPCQFKAKCLNVCVVPQALSVGRRRKVIGPKNKQKKRLSWWFLRPTQARTSQRRTREGEGGRKWKMKQGKGKKRRRKKKRVKKCSSKQRHLSTGFGNNMADAKHCSSLWQQRDCTRSEWWRRWCLLPVVPTQGRFPVSPLSRQRQSC